MFYILFLHTKASHVSLQLINTKLNIPILRSGIVSRETLLARLSEGISTKLTLISAPTGYGKTTLVLDWLVHSGSGYPAAWVSLDESENNPIQFLLYVIAALEKTQEDVGQDVRAILQGSQELQIQTILSVLINDIDLISEDFILILDDYHVIENNEVHETLNFLIDHLPTKMHIVILTRADPALPLARLRASGELVEIRARDLAFGVDEAVEFLNTSMQLDLSEDEIKILAGRTEGWIAGLQLAALSLQGREDVSQKISTFGGRTDYIVDYLIEEVLNQQSEEVSQFLLRTSILKRLNGSLCDALTGKSDGDTSLRELDQANLFVTAVDNESRWYRYHHLFADLLRYQLRAQEGETRLLDLHRRAARWFEQHALVDDALFHYLASRDMPAAASLVAAHAMPAFRRGEIHSAKKWLEALPEESIRASPRLCLDIAWTCAVRDDYEPLVKYVAATEAALPGSDYEDDPVFLGEWVALQAYTAFLLGDAQTALTLGRQALDQLASESAFVRGVINILLVDIYTSTDIGEVSQAVACGQEAMTASFSSSRITTSLYGADRLARALVLQGEYQAAEAVFLKALELVRERGQAYAPILEILDLKYAGVLYELNRLDEAERLIRDGLSLSKRFGAPYSELMCRLQLRQAQLAQKITADEVDPLATDEAIDALLLELSGRRSQPPAMDQFDAFRAQLWVNEKQLARAERWAQNAGLTLMDEPSCGKIASYLALAHAHLASGKMLPELLALLEKMHQLVLRKGHVQQIIQIGLLKVLTLDKQDLFQAAQAALEECLILAESTGMTRTFLDHGFPLIRLLRQTEHPYATKLLAAIEPGDVVGQESTPGEPTETLTEREIEVLRLYAAGLTNEAIAHRLYVSRNTVKWYAKNIYRKLDVHSRAEALSRAYEIDLLS
jgi:LuxR family maltose regulon positive regulatory protein